MGSSRRSDRRGAGELHRQHQAEPLSLGQVARVVVARQPGDDAIGQGPAGAGRGARLVVGLLALLVDRGQVEEVGGRLGHEADG